jgi:sugar O-acyltransferase (sialic acid O-acetyltransferase NeuD family)
MAKEIILVGGFNEIIALAEENEVLIVGLIDKKAGNFYKGYPILGKDEDVSTFPDYPLVITPDQPNVREKLAAYYEKHGFAFESLISKDAFKAKDVSLKEGIVVQKGVNISPGCFLGRFTKLNIASNVMHDNSIGDFTTIAPNAVILGSTKIGNNCYIGANATIMPEIQIGDNAVVGAGSVVTKDVEPHTIVYGVPAKQ